MKRIIVFLAMFGLILVSCDSGASSSKSVSYDQSEVFFEVDSLHENFIHIGATGHYTFLGTTKTNVPVKERNSMKVYFDYDFSISIHEITRGDYAALMGGNVKKNEENLPVANVTFGDVVCFANEKSKQQGLDTVYSYSHIIRDGIGHVIGFDQFNFNEEAEGYRLPTEAEWIFVASHGWNPSKGWNSNTTSSPKAVCTGEKNDLGVCDMAGNLTEWVNDWAGCLKDTTVDNFLGAPDGGASEERVIKGGSFRKNASNTQIYSRGSTYTVSMSDMADDLGARLAIGAIKDPVKLNECGNVNSTLHSVVNLSTIKNKLGTRRAKLAFVNAISGNLAYVNYNVEHYSVIEIQDSLEVKHPDISPDGEWVAFSTGEEGVISKSELYVRRLKPYGIDRVKLDVESAAIPRFEITPDGDTVIVYVNNSGNNKDDETFLKTSTWQVSFSDGKFGKPEKLFDGAYHGGLSKDRRLAVSGARILRARMADSNSLIMDASSRDTVWYNGEQACNVSLATDGSKRTLFLDFASKTGMDFSKAKYGVHERMLVVDSTGRLVKSIPSPDNFSFDHTEWVKNRDFAVATLADFNGVHSKIILLDLKDSSVTNLVRGDELMHPVFWLMDLNLEKDSITLNLDSAGVYMTTHTSAAPIIMRVKMGLFWKYRESTEVAVIGSSRSFSGVDPLEIKSMEALNLSYSAEDMTATHFFIKNYLVNLMPKLKVIVLSLDYDRLWMDDSNWKNWFGDIPGYRYDENHGFWKDGVPENMYKVVDYAVSTNDEDVQVFSFHKGVYLSSTLGYNQNDAEVAQDVNWLSNKPKEYAYNMDLLKEILNITKEHGIKVVGVVFPQSPLYREGKKGAWGRYGLTQESVKTVKNDMEALVKKYNHFTIFDEYKDGVNDYTFEEFANDDHLSLDGAYKLTRRLDSLLVQMNK